MTYPRWQPANGANGIVPAYIIGIEPLFEYRMFSLLCEKEAIAALQVDYSAIEYKNYDIARIKVKGQSYEFLYPVTQWLLCTAVHKFRHDIRLAFFQPYKDAHVALVPRRLGMAPEGLEITTQDLTKD